MNFDGISIREFIDDEEYAKHIIQSAYEKGYADGSLAVSDEKYRKGVSDLNTKVIEHINAIKPITIDEIIHIIIFESDKLKENKNEH